VVAASGPGVANCSSPIPASVPGDIYTDLHRANITADPLEAFGDWNTAWAGRTSWRCVLCQCPAPSLSTSGPIHSARSANQHCASSIFFFFLLRTVIVRLIVLREHRINPPTHPRPHPHTHTHTLTHISHVPS
jgi:hypothetical protein